MLSDGSHPANTYLAAPTASCKGVVRGIAEDVTEGGLKANLDTEGPDILLAYRMVRTLSIIVTFADLSVRRYV